MKLVKKLRIKLEDPITVYDVSVSTSTPCFSLEAGIISHNTFRWRSGIHVLPWKTELREIFIPRDEESITAHYDYCLVGNTKIKLANGTNPEIKDLVGVNEFYVYSFDTTTGKVEIGRGHDCRLVRKTSDLIELTLDDGSIVTCTPEHQFMLANGLKYVQAQDLSIGDGLVRLDTRRVVTANFNSLREEVRHLNGDFEYTQYLSNRFNIRNSIYQQLPDKRIINIHHKDFDYNNNYPTNIEIMFAGDHRRFHAKEQWNNSSRTYNGKTYRQLMTDNAIVQGAKQLTATNTMQECIQARKDGNASRHRLKLQESIKLLKDNGYSVKDIAKLTTFFKKFDAAYLALAGKDRLERGNGLRAMELAYNWDFHKLVDDCSWFLTPLEISDFKFCIGIHNKYDGTKSLAKVVQIDGIYMEMCKSGMTIACDTWDANLGTLQSNGVVGKFHGVKWETVMKFFTDEAELHRYCRNNHSIVGIRWLSGGELASTYCFSVDEFHNFFLDCGVLSKNSQQELRVMAAMANDAAMLKAFAEGRDIHRFVACFTGDTKVKLLDGRNLSFEELHSQYGNSDDKFLVFSMDKSENLVPGKAHSVRISGTVLELVEVELDSGDKFRCTPDHLWRTSGGYIKASDLISGISVSTLSSEDDKRYGMYYNSRNHKVEKVTRITLDHPVKVYDLEVDDYHNFSICLNSGDGVFVHNSKVWSMPESEVSPAQRRFSKMASFCFHGDTRIPLVDGRVMTISQLEQLYGENGESFSVYSVTDDGTVSEGQAYAPRKTKIVSKIYEIELDDGTVIKTDGSHPFMTRSGSKIKASSLESGMRLMPFYRKYNKNHYINYNYRLVFDPKSNNFNMEHHIFSDPSQEGRIIHHVNHNKYDNRRSNLVKLANQSEHLKIHCIDWYKSPPFLGLKNKHLQYMRDLMEFDMLSEDNYMLHRPNQFYIKWNNLESSLKLSIDSLIREARLLDWSGKIPSEYDYYPALLESANRYGFSSQWKDSNSRLVLQHSKKQSDLMRSLDLNDEFQLLGRKQKVINFLSKMIKAFGSESITVENYPQLREKIVSKHRSYLHSIYRHFSSLEEAVIEASKYESSWEVELYPDDATVKYSKRELHALSYIKGLIKYVKPSCLSLVNYSAINEYSDFDQKPSAEFLVLRFGGIKNALKIIFSDPDIESTDFNFEPANTVEYYSIFLDDHTKYGLTDQETLFFVRILGSVFDINCITSESIFNSFRYKLGSFSKGIRMSSIIGRFGSLNDAYNTSLTIQFNFDFSLIRRSTLNRSYSHQEVTFLRKVYNEYRGNSLLSERNFREIYPKTDVDHWVGVFGSFSNILNKSVELVSAEELNHIVKNVRVVELDSPIQLYDVTVDVYHNLAVVGNNDDSGIFVFQSILYGKGTETLAVDFLDGDIEKAEKLMNDFYTSFPSVKTFIEARHKEVDDSGVVHTIFGNPIYVGKAGVGGHNQGDIHRAAQNYCIQSSASSIAAYGIWAVYEECLRRHLRAIPMCFTHDAADWNVYTEDLFEFGDIVLEMAVEDIKKRFNTPVAIDFEYGIHQDNMMSLAETERGSNFRVFNFETTESTFDRMVQKFNTVYRVEYEIQKTSKDYLPLEELFISKRAFSKYLGTFVTNISGVIRLEKLQPREV